MSLFRSRKWEMDIKPLEGAGPRGGCESEYGCKAHDEWRAQMGKENVTQRGCFFIDMSAKTASGCLKYLYC